MSGATSGFHAPGGWSWPEDLPGAHPTEQQQQQQQEKKTESSNPPDTGATNTNEQSSKTPKEKYWKLRTCRICLETVPPTFHPPSEHLPRMFQGGPNVTYDSDSGHLISPCKCKGSSRYVHDTCLQQWRHADPSYAARYFWKCPTCHFQYRLERMNWGRWIGSPVMQLVLTITIFLTAIFILGFVADPIINLYIDPLGTIVDSRNAFDDHYVLDEDSSWVEHFIKGLASLGLLGFVKVFFSLSPFQWLNLRGGGFMGGSRRGGTGRDRMSNISWVVVLLGIVTFLYTVWKGVRVWSASLLKKAGERVVDVQGDDMDDDDDDNDEPNR